jgi:hypothetical protein
VDGQILSGLENAVVAAKKAGLVVEYRADVEALVKRLAKAIREETAKHSNHLNFGQQD